MKNSLSLTIKVHEFHSTQPGPALLIFGAVHGNEKCGTQALTKLISLIETGEIVLNRGSLTIVPIANPLAYERDVRYIKENINRIFRPTPNPRTDEARFANILCRLIDRCDAFLDIHSITAEGDAFLYLDFPTSNNKAWAKVMPVKNAIVGWPELYKKMGLLNQAFDSNTYAHMKNKDCLVIECGQHKAPSSPTIAYEAILNSLRYFSLIKGRPSKRSVSLIKMKSGYFRKHKNDRLAKNWKHLDPINKGQPLIINNDGSIIKSPLKGLIIMPKATAPVGDDWLYLGLPNQH